MSLFLLFGGTEVPATPVESTALLPLTFTHSVTGEILTVVESTAALVLSVGHTVAPWLYECRTVALGATLGHAVNGWTLAKYSTAVTPIIIGHTVTSNGIHFGDSIDLEVNWYDEELIINNGASITFDNIVQLVFRALSSAALDGPYQIYHPSFFRVKVDNGSWSSWYDWEPSGYGKKRHKRMQYYNVTISGYGNHTIYIDFMDNDGNTIDTLISGTITYMPTGNEPSTAPYRAPDIEIVPVHRDGMIDIYREQRPVRRRHKLYVEEDE